MAKAKQEEAREACQAKYVEGSDFFRAEQWDDAIASFEGGLLEKVNDDGLLKKLKAILKDTHIGKARALDIESVTEQVAGVELVFISGAPHQSGTWSTTEKTSVYGTYRGDQPTRSLQVHKQSAVAPVSYEYI